MWVSFKPWVPKGSLKDKLYEAKPNEKYFKKYPHLAGKHLNEKQIAKYGRQVLEGLHYLKTHKIPFSHLHSGNVMLDNNVCRISDYDNDMIGVAPRGREYIRPNLEKVDPMVLSFGYLLYEVRDI